MIIRRFVKSGKSIFIVILLFIMFWMVLMIDSQVRTQMVTIRENDRLKADNEAVAKWRDCFKSKNLYEIDGVEYVRLSEIQECGK